MYVSSLAKRLQEQSVIFRQSQRKYLAEVQAQKSGGIVAGDSKFGIDFNGTTTTEGGGDFFTTQQLAVVDDLTAAVQSRDQEIVKIANKLLFIIVWLLVWKMENKELGFSF